MGGDERKSKRTVRDLSHLLISTKEKKKYLILGCLNAGPQCLRGEFDEASGAFQAQSFRITVLDFHGSDPRQSQGAQSLLFPDSDFVRSNAVGTDVWLIELPWFLTEVGRFFASKFDGCVFLLKPSVASFKTAYRFLKALSPGLSGEIFLKWDRPEADNHRTEQILVSDLIKRFLGKTVYWIAQWEQVFDKLPKISENREEKDLDWLREEVSAMAGREPLSFYANGELTVTELEAFSDLSRRFFSDKSNPVEAQSAKI
jgi:hypothetical protein